MKKSLITFIALMMIIVMSTSAAYAWFSSQGKVRGIGVSVGSSGLLINGVNEWTAGVSFDNIVPGWASDPILTVVQNTGDGVVPLELKARVLFTGSDFQELAGTMLMAIEEVGSVEAPDFQTLTWWSETGKVLEGGSLVQGEERSYNLLFKLPTESSDDIQNSVVDLSVLLTGTQVQ
jgi:hypothetical protein